MLRRAKISEKQYILTIMHAVVKSMFDNRRPIGLSDFNFGRFIIRITKCTTPFILTKRYCNLQGI